MIESSTFSNNQPRYDAVEPMSMQGGTCDAYRVKLYGKLHFLKRLKPPYANDIRHREALRKEFETGYRLEHPQLPRYLSFDGDAILMEYIDGETLTQRLSSTPDYFLDKKHVSKLLDQLLSVMAYLHSQQVLHLDLKPDNIMLTRIGNDVKLIDLGCCLTDTYTDTTGRTDRYAAPEQLHGGSLDASTDIYAVGRVLSELPYSSPLYNKVIERCTAPDMSDRYATVEEIRQAFISHERRTRYWRIALSALLAASIIITAVCLFLPDKTLAPATTEQAQTADTLPSIQTTTLTNDQTTLQEITAPQTTNPPAPQTTKTPVPQTTEPPAPQTTKPLDPQTTEQRPDAQEQMRNDVRQTLLPLFNATLGSLTDSAALDPRAWNEAYNQFFPLLDPALKQLVADHPDVSPESVVMEFYNCMKSLITLKQNSARMAMGAQ